MSKLKSIKYYKSLIYKNLLTCAVLIFLIIVGFKKVRNYFPLPQISEGKIIGFSQFYGYPLYFDTLLFFVIFLIPVFVFLFFYFKNK